MSNTMSHMLDKYDPGLVGGFIGALIAIAVGKFVESIYMVHTCKKQVDSLDVLIQSVEPILILIEGKNDNVWSQEIGRARVSIKREWETISLEWSTVSTYNVKALRHISKRSTHLISDIYNKMQVAQLAAAGLAAERLAQLVVAERTAERGWEERQRSWMQGLEDLDRISIDQREKSTKVWLRFLDEAVRVRQWRMEESERIWTERLEESARVWQRRLEELERVWMEKLGWLEELGRVRMERLGQLEESLRVWMQRVEESTRISLEQQQELKKIWVEPLEARNASPLPSPSSLEPGGVWDAPISPPTSPPTMFTEDPEIPWMDKELWHLFAGEHTIPSSPPSLPFELLNEAPLSPLLFSLDENEPFSTVEVNEMPLPILPRIYTDLIRRRGGSGGNRHGNQADTSAHSHLP